MADLERLVRKLLKRQVSRTDSVVRPARPLQDRARFSDRRIRELLEKDAAD